MDGSQQSLLSREWRPENSDAKFSPNEKEHEQDTQADGYPVLDFAHLPYGPLAQEASGEEQGPCENEIQRSPIHLGGELHGDEWNEQESPRSKHDDE